MSDSAPPERTRDLERLLTFVDAIVAIAITLLVLPLAELAGEVGKDQSVWHLVREHAGQFGAFVLSFVVIARLWHAQHRIVRHAVDATGRLVAGLIGWTLTIVFLPFPSALLANVGDQAATKVLYIGTLTLSAAALSAIAVQVRRQLPDSETTPRSTPALLDATALAVALVVCVFVPVVSYLPLLLLVVSGMAEGRLERRAAGQPGNA